MPLLLPRVGLGDDDANRVLIESSEAAFALQILQMTHDRPSQQNAFVGGGFGRYNGD
jgi:hypothetical protein